jgi:flagellar motor protein MotB
MGVLALMVIGAAGTGCQNKLYQENLALHEQNRELQARLAAESNEPKADPAQISQLQSQLAERDAKLAELQNQLKQPAADQTSADVQGVEATYDRATAKVTVAVPGDILFSPGDATIRDTAKGTLDKVAASLRKDYAGKSIRVEGHTDADPIKYSKWKSNQDLSVARAAAVKAYLVKKGVDASLVTVQGYGSDKPKAKDKSVNRRVDIVVATR